MGSKEMFEKLGYYLLFDASELSYRADINDKDYIQIIFHKNSKNWHIIKVIDNGDYSIVYPVSMQLQKAINKQIEELGWIK